MRGTQRGSLHEPRQRGGRPVLRRGDGLPVERWRTAPTAPVHARTGGARPVHRRPAGSSSSSGGGPPWPMTARRAPATAPGRTGVRRRDRRALARGPRSAGTGAIGAGRGGESRRRVRGRAGGGPAARIARLPHRRTPRGSVPCSSALPVLDPRRGGRRGAATPRLTAGPAPASTVVPGRPRPAPLAVVGVSRGPRPWSPGSCWPSRPGGYFVRAGGSRASSSFAVLAAVVLTTDVSLGGRARCRLPGRIRRARRMAGAVGPCGLSEPAGSHPRDEPSPFSTPPEFGLGARRHPWCAGPH